MFSLEFQKYKWCFGLLDTMSIYIWKLKEENENWMKWKTRNPGNTKSNTIQSIKDGKQNDKNRNEKILKKQGKWHKKLKNTWNVRGLKVKEEELIKKGNEV